MLKQMLNLKNFFDQKRMYESLYEKIKTPTELPWHREEAPEYLDQVVRDLVQSQKDSLKEGTDKEKKALDLGCGSGIYSCFMVKNGLHVTALDFISKALELTAERARQENLEMKKLNLVKANVLRWETHQKFDLIFDSGCMHSLRNSDLKLYKKQILSWLAPDGNYILIHFSKRHLADWRFVGPRKRTREEIVDLFSPELVEIESMAYVYRNLPLPIGPTVRVGQYHFKRLP